MFRILWKNRIWIAFVSLIGHAFWAQYYAQADVSRFISQLAILVLLYGAYAKGYRLAHWTLISLVLGTIYLIFSGVYESPGKGPYLVLPFSLLFLSLICLLLTPIQTEHDKRIDIEVTP